MSLFILGRQPKIGLAELESLFGAETITPVGFVAAKVSIPASEINFTRIGGSLKLCQELTELNTADWRSVENYLLQQLPKQIHDIPEGKLKLGLSVYGTPMSASKINATGLSLKKAIKQTGRSVRIVPNKESSLNAAQVLRNKLTDDLGLEINVIFAEQKVILAQTVAIQDIDAYAARDHGRPMRDTRVGMLPPKLAQIIINLAHGSIVSPAQEKQCTILDPFCGTGVVLQEALLMGYNALGSDLEPRMVEYSSINLKWLQERAQLTGSCTLLEADATNETWKTIDTIACETYLGRPFSALPTAEVLREVMHDVNTIHQKFLENIARQTESGFRMCIAVPAWKMKNDFLHLKVLDSLEEMGYTRQSFVHARNDQLIYHRESQIVGRELVTLIRK